MEGFLVRDVPGRAEEAAFSSNHGTIVAGGGSGQLAGLTERTLRITIPSESYSPETAMKTITLKLPEPLDAKLAAAARNSGVTKSALVRDLLSQALSGDRAAAPGSCLALAEDLVGCVKGPADLSCNKKHLRGFGQ